MYHKWGGFKTVFGEGLYGMFSPPLSSPPPFVFSLKLPNKFLNPFFAVIFRSRITDFIPAPITDLCKKTP